jgi:hypothetical protein
MNECQMVVHTYNILDEVDNPLTPTKCIHPDGWVMNFQTALLNEQLITHFSAMMVLPNMYALMSYQVKLLT